MKILKFYRRFCLDVKWSNNVLADIDFHRILPLVLNPKLLNRIGWPIQIYADRAVPEHKNFESRAAVVHLNFRAGSTFPFPVCTVPSSMDRTSRCNKVDAVRLYALYSLNLLLINRQIWILSKTSIRSYKEIGNIFWKIKTMIAYSFSIIQIFL